MVLYYIGRHDINQLAERTDPDTFFDKTSLHKGHIDRFVHFDHTDRTQNPNISHLFHASGRLQTLCYKADIEAALRTPGFAGFQLLDLHDFPGQGTALVGVLDPFWDSKGYVTGEEYSQFCNRTVPLARFPKLVWTNDEQLSASLEVAHFGEKTVSA